MQNIFYKLQNKSSCQILLVTHEYPTEYKIHSQQAAEIILPKLSSILFLRQSILGSDGLTKSSGLTES